ncbi:MAG: YceI family protein, partial [Pirellulaceae bacterium]|nr:YceI family protein [Pirellulaceae bacterium]
GAFMRKNEILFAGTKIFTLLLTVVVFATLVNGQVARGADEFKFSNEGSKITFVGSNVGAEKGHEGGFEKFSGVLALDKEDFTKSSLAVLIDMKSITSDSRGLTGHLKNADFFEVDKYESASFHSTKITKGEKEGAYTLAGKMKIKEVEKEIQVPVTVVIGEKEVTIKGTLNLDRTQFGITYGTSKIDKNVPVTIDLKASRAETKK